MEADHAIESVIRALMCLTGILGNNWLAICSLSRQKSGLRTNEILFINLAVSNLITNYLVDLPDTVADFAGRWFLGETYCSIFRFCADLSETSSIFTTLFISAFWYQKLVGSLKRGGAPVQLDSLRLVGCLLAGSWTVATIFSIPHFFFVSVKGSNGSAEDCIDVFPNAFAMKTFETIYLTLANAFPIAGIVFASVRIVITLLQNQRRIRGHNSDKEGRKAENKSVEKKNDDTSVCTISNQGTSSSLTTHVYSGVPASSCPNAELSGPLPNGEPDHRPEAQPNPPKHNQVPSKPSPNSSTQVRAAKSVLAVAFVVLVCWLTHLLLRISNNIHTSKIVEEVASYIAASYTSIIPYIFLHGVKKLTCSCKR